VAARLDATPAGEVLYRRLGFVAEYGLTRWFLDGKRSDKRPAMGVRPLTPIDWPAILAMDARAFGASRTTLLQRFVDEAPDYAWVAEHDGRLEGYLLGRHGRLREHFGPLIADSAEIAGRLLDACLAAHPQCSVYLDAPDGQRSWSALLVEHGFAVERPFLRMYRGRLTTPGQSSHVYAIAGPEFG
jgi:GNAT acetyltransferase-like protein